MQVAARAPLTHALRAFMVLVHVAASDGELLEKRREQASRRGFSRSVWDFLGA